MNQPKQWSIKLDLSEQGRGWIYPTNHTYAESCNGQVIEVGAYEQLKKAKEENDERFMLERDAARLKCEQLLVAGKGLVEVLKFVSKGWGKEPVSARAADQVLSTHGKVFE